jgi:predicted secreted hydrolase
MKITLLVAAIVMSLFRVDLGQAQSGDPYVFMRGAEDGHAKVLPGGEIEFPRDHGAHPEFRIEWWYVTANLQDGRGAHYGVQWTMFRQSLSPIYDANATEQGGVMQGWASNQVWLAHAAITNDKQHRHWQKMARGGIGQAGVVAQPFSAWIDHWSLATAFSLQADGLYPLDLNFSVYESGEYAVNLQLTADTPEVLNGLEGYSRKSAGDQASYYYSQPHLEVSGDIVWQDELVSVTGQAWLDREWSSQPLSTNQSGWDWFSIHLDDGRALMLYQIREIAGKDKHWVSGSLIAKNGSKVNIQKKSVNLEVLETKVVDGRKLPLRWRVSIPEYDIDLTIEPLHDEQFISGALPYWEGVIFAFDSKDDSQARQQVGRGYMELMGYN